MPFIMMPLAIGLALALLAGLALRWSDQRALAREWARLAGLAAPAPARFEPEMIADLPEPARRYLTWAIQPGTPLAGLVEVTMTGRFGLGDQVEPRYQPMRARQILTPPDGFVWEMHGTGAMPVSGSDSGGWTRFALAGILPVARSGGTADHRRSAFGRMLAEAAIWCPSALMPGPHVTWSSPAADVARVSLRDDGIEHVVDLQLTASGAPSSVVMQRWSNANPAKRWQYQPFGGDLSDYREVAGHHLPFHAEVGNFYGTPDYFPFFIADLTGVRFPG
ncbi:DUF6544 family protein [Pseudooceanicola sp.]|uniref:DUF6544 family protein n=1 Tax=Pseudooceanicola sp. TaxID=1914328 RepID=UPI0026358F11|nr:DUF6544 family protein [Pseudooceanicola sp.]MDF1854582.1 hypothetical protein [Pseudooceanicola sp.]